MSIRERLAALNPAFALEVRTPSLTLRFPTDEDLVDLAELAMHGVHAPDTMPFETPWTEVPAPYQQRNSLQWFWQQRATIQGDAPFITMATVVDDVVVGTQGLFSASWKGSRTFETGSWIGLGYQGRGVGKEMRVAALQLGFDGFGAVRMITEAFADNPSSVGVTESLGYRSNGDVLVARRGQPTRSVRYVMEPDDFAPLRRDDIEIVGADAVREMLGSEHVPGQPPPESGS